jgi:YesN/AraC family two-component response regulator
MANQVDEQSLAEVMENLTPNDLQSLARRVVKWEDNSQIRFREIIENAKKTDDRLDILNLQFDSMRNEQEERNDSIQNQLSSINNVLEILSSKLTSRTRTPSPVLEGGPNRSARVDFIPPGSKTANSEEIKLKIDQVNSDRRILLVDDEPYNIMGLKIQLIQSGYKDIISYVDQAFNGLEAIQKVK